MDYKVFRGVDIGVLEDLIDEKASQGWRVVSVVPMHGYMYLVIFGRERSDGG
jgi:hypothetical protein